MTLMPVAEWLEATYIGTLVRESLWGFPIVVALHLAGLIFSVGVVVWWDMRLLGVSMRTIPVTRVYRRLMPIACAGFTVMFVSGAMLFAGYATAAIGNTYFRLKLTALVLAAANAALYHRLTERTVSQWEVGVRPPLGARVAGLASVLLWVGVILAGRMMSYTMF